MFEVMLQNDSFNRLNKYLHNDTRGTEVNINTTVNNGSGKF